MLPRLLPVALLLVLPLTARPALAQTQFAELSRPPLLPASVDTTRAVAIADLDGDGDLDLVCANFRAQNRVFRNDGRSFTDVTAQWMPSDTDASYAVAVGDLDGDKDVDVVFGNGFQQNRLYLNDSTGKLVDVTAAKLPVDTDDTHAVALGDVDGDGDLDLVTGNKNSPSGQQDRLYLNDGRATFSDATASALPADSTLTRSIALGDVDGDRDLDIVVGNDAYHDPRNWKSGYEDLYLNDGTGKFSRPATFPRIDDFTMAAALADLDGDGDLDLVTANSVARDCLFLNDGRGNFADRSAQLPTDGAGSTSVAIADVDHDGDLDLVFAGLAGLGGRKRLFVNDGAATFTDATASRLPGLVDRTPGCVALADLNGDGHPDLAIGNENGVNEIVLNDGSGGYPVCRRLGPDDAPSVVVAGDVDADGDLDLVAASDKAQNRLYRNDGAGWFTDVTQGSLPLASNASRCLALGDVDGDGDLDLVFGNYGQKNVLYANDGRGVFTDVSQMRLPPDAETTTAVALVDVDGDRDLDLVCANASPAQRNRLYLNDGQGTFTDATLTHLPADQDSTGAIAFGDVDRDGDVDLVFGNGYTRDRLFLSDGLGRFSDATATHLPPDVDWTAALLLADLDGDGDLDLVCGNSMSGQDRYYQNDGAGRFLDVTATHMPMLAVSTRALAAADVDGDGDLDLALAVSAPERQDRLLVNDGSGRLADATAVRLPPDTSLTVSVALADIDADGDVDAIWGNDGLDVITVNRHRQAFAAAAPRLGDSHRIDVYGLTGYAPTVQLAIPYLATSSACLPVPPFGVFGLDPTTMVVLDAVALGPPAGTGHVHLPVPPVAALTFLPLYVQALIVSDMVPERGWRLTNVHRDRVRQ